VPSGLSPFLRFELLEGRGALADAKAAAANWHPNWHPTVRYELIRAGRNDAERQKKCQ
jgi:hypothetical protein